MLPWAAEVHAPVHHIWTLIRITDQSLITNITAYGSLTLTFDLCKLVGPKLKRHPKTANIYVLSFSRFFGCGMQSMENSLATLPVYVCAFFLPHWNNSKEEMLKSTPTHSIVVAILFHDQQLFQTVAVISLPVTDIDKNWLRVGSWWPHNLL